MRVVCSTPGVILIISITLSFLQFTNSQPKSSASCEKNVPSSFTFAQKVKFCKEADIGAAVCALEAKKQLKSSFEDIYELCSNSSTAAPVMCMKELSTKERESIGVSLCSGAYSYHPGSCWKEVASLQGFNKLDSSQVISFCKAADTNSFTCIRAATKRKIFTLDESMKYCSGVTGIGSFISDCIDTMINQSPSSVNTQSNSRGRSLNKTDMIQFCTSVTSLSPIQCYSNTDNIAIAPLDRLSLCEGSSSVLGPPNCIRAVLKASGASRVSSDKMIDLCKLAQDAGPVACFAEGRASLGENLAVAVCQQASDKGPAVCYRRSKILLQDQHFDRISLCRGAQSDDPADCAAKLPSWLSSYEKILLCNRSPVGRHNEPNKCLQVVETASRTLFHAPSSKSFGIPVTTANSMLSGNDLNSRSLLISMCSFSSSRFPMAAAECLQSVPRSMEHDEAIRMCTNASNTDSGMGKQQQRQGNERHAMGQCVHQLSAEWSSSDASVLCETVSSKDQMTAVIECATHSTAIPLRLNRHDAALVCKHESPLQRQLAGQQQQQQLAGAGPGPVLTCLRAMRLESKGKAIDISIIEAVCGQAMSNMFAQRTEKGEAAQGQGNEQGDGTGSSRWTADTVVAAAKDAGTCVAKASRQSYITFASGAMEALCSSPSPLQRLACLERSGRRIVQTSDVETCKEERSVLTSVRVTRFAAENNQVEATAGKWFSVWLQLLDQFGQNMVVTGTSLSVKINVNNAQGAVLWGIRSNSSVQGVVQLNRLVVSQPGPVELTVLNDKQQPLELFRMDVNQNPETEQSNHCIDVFRLSVCPVTVSESDVLSEYPMERGYLGKERYLYSLACASTLSTWHVTVSLTPVGAVWIQYKKGIEAIWTGQGLPTPEMNSHTLLDTSLNATAKELRRAYYRKSLQWHPDRWATAPMYTIVSTGVFELINHAYEEMSNALRETK